MCKLEIYNIIVKKNVLSLLLNEKICRSLEYKRKIMIY